MLVKHLVPRLKPTLLDKLKQATKFSKLFFFCRNNRITTEGAVLLGKGLYVNESLKTLRVGTYLYFCTTAPLQSSPDLRLKFALTLNQRDFFKMLNHTMKALPMQSH